MKFVKKAAKFLVVSLLAFTIVKPQSIPRLPPIKLIAESVETVHLS